MTTIVLVRKNNEVVVASDGQVSMGNTVIKKTANKVRKIEKRNVIAGFAGSTADALTLFERLESKLEKHAGNLTRAAVELAKDWRTDKYLRRLEALMAGYRPKPIPMEAEKRIEITAHFMGKTIGHSSTRVMKWDRPIEMP